MRRRRSRRPGSAGRAGCSIRANRRTPPPATVSPTIAFGEPATTAATPVATIAVAARWPPSIPPTDGTVCPRIPAAIAYAQSAPGVITNIADTAQNDTINPVCIVSTTFHLR
ncbi:hypothetical protein ACFOJ6_21065 [Gordonia humi]|uniref:hypothetical protein n=1 Tax=Gordonia humi TaxID=686429 RepID=UPI00361EC758